MAVRSTMAALISRTRLLIYDTGGTPQFADQDVQDALDRHRAEVRYAVLRPTPDFGAGGIVTYAVYQSDQGNWETNEVLTGPDFSVVTPATSDEQVGRWTFATSQIPPVRITGFVYDLFGAAAELLEQWAAAVMLKFAFTVDANTYHPEQQRAALLELASQYRRQAWPLSALILRSDENTDQGFGMTAWYDDPRNA